MDQRHAKSAGTRARTSPEPASRGTGAYSSGKRVATPRVPLGKLRRGLLLLTAVLALALGGLKWYERAHRPPPEEPPAVAAVPLPSWPESPFRNTRPDVAYVGSEACRACHAGHDASFRRTGMGHSMGTVQPDREPPDAAFDHPLSRRRYEIRKSVGKLWHRELLVAGDKKEVLLVEFPLKYVVGSGHFSRTYLVEDDGFLMESPATWYASRKAWGMSPGYEGAEQPGFSRPIDIHCLYCHAGRVEEVGGAVHKLRVIETEISCERCHGPGALHVSHQRDDKPAGEEMDFTIVNPAHLSRDLAEAVCQQCHLQSDALALVRGRKQTDFRPGLPLTDFVHHYRLATAEPLMTVVGHVEQLHLSRCYQASAELSCLTCHDPHRPARHSDLSRSLASCRSCHEEPPLSPLGRGAGGEKPQPPLAPLGRGAGGEKPQPPLAPLGRGAGGEGKRCKVDPAERSRQSPDNNCVHCHMPPSATDIPHLAFTHHRIGIHKTLHAAARLTPNPSSPSGVGGSASQGALEPVLDLGRLSDPERAWSLGMAYLALAEKQTSPDSAVPYLHRTIEQLRAAQKGGIRDPSTDVSLDLAEFLLYRRAPAAVTDSSHAKLAANERCSALFVGAYSRILAGAPETALPLVRQLVGLRRNASDWLLLAGCEQAAGNVPASIAALEQAVYINPRLWQAHQQLAEHYRRAGQKQRALLHEQRAVP